MLLGHRRFTKHCSCPSFLAPVAVRAWLANSRTRSSCRRVGRDFLFQLHSGVSANNEDGQRSRGGTCISIRTRDFHSKKRSKLNSFDLAANVKRKFVLKFVLIFVLFLATFAPLAFPYPDNLSENDSACSQSEMLKESSVKIPTHRNQQSLAVVPRLFASNNSTCSPSSSERTTTPTLLSLAACVLRC